MHHFKNLFVTVRVRDRVHRLDLAATSSVFAITIKASLSRVVLVVGTVNATSAWASALRISKRLLAISGV